MENDPAKQTATPTDDTSNEVVNIDLQTDDVSQVLSTDPIDLEKEKASNVFQTYMQSFSNKQIMSVYGQKHLDELVNKKREFWDSQPVPKTKDLITGDLADKHGALEKKTIDDVRKEPYPLPAGFEWGIVDMDNDAELEELFEHLYNHYVEDEDGYFRFRYGKGFIKWALTPPGYEKELLISIKDSKSGKIVSFIAGVVINLRIEKKLVKATEVNFLCVHKDMRKMRVAPVLIKEVTRRSNLKGVWQGFYTSGQMLPTPIAQARYFHRALNPKKLVDVQFSSLPKSQSMKIHEKIYAVRDQLPFDGVRPMVDADVPKLYEEFNKKEVKHFFLPREDILSCYVVTDGANIVGLTSFYHLPSTILKSENHKELRACYCYYVIPGKYDLKTMFEATLVLAKQEGFDVFNALDIMENKEVFEGLLFKPGDGFLQYYMYNWKLLGSHLQPAQIGKVLF